MGLEDMNQELDMVFEVIIRMSSSQHKASLLFHKFFADCLVTLGQHWETFLVVQETLYSEFDAEYLFRDPSLEEIIEVGKICTQLKDSSDPCMIATQLLKSNILVISILSIIEVARHLNPQQEP